MFIRTIHNGHEQKLINGKRKKNQEEIGIEKHLGIENDSYRY